jgi:alkyl sulfatase BDS1-like metallo-beta-lactamase superfamily hydrolase
MTPSLETKSWKRLAWLVPLGALSVALGLILYRIAIIALAGSGLDPRIPAALRVRPSSNSELAEHSRLYEKKVFTIGERVHAAVGFGLANIIWIEGTDGLVIVDTGETLEQANAVLAEIRKVSQKPVMAVVLTHHHADHVLGTSAFVSAEDATGGKIPIFAHESLVKHYVAENGVIAELQTIRSAHMYGGSLGPADRAGSNNGIGPFLGRGPTGFLPPTRTFSDRLEVTVAGVRLEMLYVPSEAESEIAVYLPDSKTLLSAEVVQDHTFPNLYTIRGARYRDPVQWVRSLDRLRDLDAESMVLQHGPPVLGKADVAHVLTFYRDQIQFVHDQTIRYMNRGLTPVELAETIHLPPHLANERPWGGQFYGTVQHSVRNIYGGYVGWFAGDPVDLDPTPPVELARRTIALMGGHDAVFAAARRAFDAGDSQFAAELATPLIRVNAKDTDARHLKAAAFRKLGYAQISASWRNYYLVSAMELDEQLPGAAYLQAAATMLGSAMLGLPAANQVDMLPPRLRAEDTLDQDVVVGIRYTDAHEEFRLHLRRGVLEISRKPLTDARAILEVTRGAMGAMLSGTTLEQSVASGGARVTGDADLATRFFGWFDKPFRYKPDVVVR